MMDCKDCVQVCAFADEARAGIIKGGYCPEWRGVDGDTRPTDQPSGDK